MDLSSEQMQCKRFCDECDELRENLRLAEAAGVAHVEREAEARETAVEMRAALKRYRYE